MQEEVAIYDIMASKGEPKETKSNFWRPLQRWFPGEQNNNNETIIPDDRIIRYHPIHINPVEEVKATQESIEKSLKLRATALKSVSSAINAAIQGLQRYSEALGRVGKCFHEVTSSHVRYLVLKEDIRQPGKLQDGIKARERRFRELGDRFVDLINQLQPGLAETSIVATGTVLEVIGEQQNELGYVRAYFNREIHSLKMYDQAAGKRMDLEKKIASLSSSTSDKITKWTASLELAKKEEDDMHEEYRAKEYHLRSEMEKYWDDTSCEFFSAVRHIVKESLNVGRVHADALRAWFPPSIDG